MTRDFHLSSQSTRKKVIMEWRLSLTEIMVAWGGHFMSKEKSHLAKTFAVWLYFIGDYFMRAHCVVQTIVLFGSPSIKNDGSLLQGIGNFFHLANRIITCSNGAPVGTINSIRCGRTPLPVSPLLPSSSVAASRLAFGLCLWMQTVRSSLRSRIRLRYSRRQKCKELQYPTIQGNSSGFNIEEFREIQTGQLGIYCTVGYRI